MKYRVWATFRDKGSPLLLDFNASSVEEARKLGINYFAKAERILVDVPIDNDDESVVG